MSDFSLDLGSVLGTQETPKVAGNSTNKKAGSDLVMDDFLKLMVAQFQNQTVDNTADTTEMMNQMVQMSVIQAITNLSTLVSDSTNLSYAASLVGKEVTIGQRHGSEIEELLGTVTGTGTLNGKQVIFLNNEETPYNLTDIMAVGKLPEHVSTNAAANKAANSANNATGDAANAAASTGADTGSAATDNGTRDPHEPDEDGALG